MCKIPEAYLRKRAEVYHWKRNLGVSREKALVILGKRLWVQYVFILIETLRDSGEIRLLMPDRYIGSPCTTYLIHTVNYCGITTREVHKMDGHPYYNTALEFIQFKIYLIE